MELLRELSMAFGPSGNEEAVRNIIAKHIKPYVDEIKVDKYGNLIAHKKGNHLKVMLSSHMDEVGLMIKGIDSTGNISCSGVGGVDPLNFLGERVHIKTKKGYIYGVITTSQISNDEEPENIPKMEDLIIDTGLTKTELIKLGVEAGTYLNLDRYFLTLGNKDYVCGKALDDRTGCYILIETAKKLKGCKADIYYVFTVQEEVGLYGAKTSIYGISPDIAIIVDVTNADDMGLKSTKILGKGPCLTIKDSDMITNRKIDELIKKVAKKSKINLQLDVTDVGTTDALSVSIAKGGIPTTVLGVAVRNLHTTVGVAHMKDINDCVTLLYELLRKEPKF
ncbi:MAG TPA: M28 family peptidase [Candidatus Nanoarchaeia archaeon]|nr:M28 family peptidase [Candidatus Nanoarchaeia archaeon]